jgi:hypothetical protein
MYLDFGLVSNALRNSVYVSDYRVIEADEASTLTITVPTLSSAYIEVNGIDYGSSVTVLNGDRVRIRMTSANALGTPVTSYVRQNDVLVGFFSIVTSSLYDFYYDTAYDLLYSFETIYPWTPDASHSLRSFDFNGNPVGTYSLTSTQSGRILRNLMVLDYHRNLVSVFDTLGKTMIKTISGNGPTDSVDLYDNEDVKSFSFVAFHLDNKITVLNNLFDVVSEITVPDVSSIALFNGDLYAIGKYGSIVYRLTFDGTNLTIADQTDLDVVLVDIVVHDQVYLLTPSALIDLSGNELVAIPAQSRDHAIADNVLWLTHGQFNYVTKIDLTLFTATQEIVDPTAIFIDSITIQNNGRVYITDIDAKKIYVRGVYNGNWDVAISGQGVALSDLVYVADLYPSMPPKIEREQLVFEIDRTAFTDIQDIAPGQIVTTGDILLVSSNKVMRATLLDTASNLELLKNGVVVSKDTTITTGDTLAIRYLWDFFALNPTTLSIVIAQELYEITLFGSADIIVPNDFVFTPLVQQPVSTQVLSNIVTVTGLQRPVEITTVADLIINGVPQSSPYMLNNSDTIQLSALTPDQGCETLSLTVDFESRYQAEWTVSTFTELPETPLEIHLADVTDAPLAGYVISGPQSISVSEPTELRLTTLYGAEFILNGSLAGQTIIVDSGDSIAVRMQTTYNYRADHTVYIHCCYATFAWTITTKGYGVPLPFDFGSQSDLSIQDRVTADVQIIGISDDVDVRMVFPHHTYPLLNGVPLVTDTDLLDYRGVLLDSFVVTKRVNEYDTVTLDGYPRPEHGSTHEFPVNLGGRIGYWTLTTFEIFDAVSVTGHKHAQISPGVAVSYATGYSEASLPSALVFRDTDAISELVSSFFVVPDTDAISELVSSFFVVPDTTVTFDIGSEYTTISESIIVVDSVALDALAYSYSMPVSESTYDAVAAANYSPVLFDGPTAIVLSGSYLHVQLETDGLVVGSSWNVVDVTLDALAFTTSTALADRPDYSDYVVFGSSFYSSDSRGASAVVLPSNWYSVNRDIFEVVTHDVVTVVLLYIEEAIVQEAPNPVFAYPHYTMFTANTVTVDRTQDWLVARDTDVLADGPTALVQADSTVDSDIGVAAAFVRSSAIVVPTGIAVQGKQHKIASVPTNFEVDPNSFTRTPPYNTLHPGYFIDALAAADDAYSWGYEDGEFYAVNIDGKGWAWTLEMPCANMCDPNSCPPYGYIQGG